tara:strand:- start:11136 stop:12335 length:1200 start_codon:yes stop_codon:yes gene_type:complete
MNYNNNILKSDIIKNIHNINSKIPNIQLSANSITLLKDIIFNLEIATKQFLDFSKHKLKIVNKPNFPCNKLLPYYLIKELKLNNHFTYSITFTISQRLFTINFIIFKKFPLLTKFLLSSVKHIYHWLYIAQLYSNNDCSLNANINIYFHQQTKNIPNKNVLLSNEHINTAFTWSCNKLNNDNEINIYRYEEWFKVFIHETFHMFGLDFSYMQNLSSYNLLLQQKFKTKIDFFLFECYCETWANIINSLYISYNHSYRVNNKHNWIMNILKKTNHLLNQERAFALMQSSKILNIHNIQYNDFFNKNEISYTETTPIFSYYLFKSILLFHTDTFLSWCYKYNHNSIKFNIQNINVFYHLILLLYKKPLFIENMELIQSYINKNLSPKKNVFKTLRMSIHEL